jgi:hypothetical protein
MSIPGFNAAASLRQYGQNYVGRGVPSASPTAIVVPHRSAFGGSRISSGLGFSCGPWGCICTGDADCNDMFSTNACGPYAVCSIDHGFCICGRP